MGVFASAMAAGILAVRFLPLRSCPGLRCPIRRTFAANRGHRLAKWRPSGLRFPASGSLHSDRLGLLAILIVAAIWLLNVSRPPTDLGADTSGRVEGWVRLAGNPVSIASRTLPRPSPWTTTRRRLPVCTRTSARGFGQAADRGSRGLACALLLLQLRAAWPGRPGGVCPGGRSTGHGRSSARGCSPGGSARSAGF